MINKQKFVLFIFTTVILLLIYKVYTISILSHDYYSKLAKNNITQTKYSLNSRGEIYDANNMLLAYNKIGFSIYIAPHLKNKDLNKTVNSIVKILPNIKKSKIYKNYKSKESFYSHSYIKIINMIDYNSMIKIYANINLIKFVKIDTTSKRVYPFKNLASHVIGYASNISKYEKNKYKYLKYADIVGKTGIEKYYELFLKGELNKQTFKVNAKNKKIKEIQRYFSKRNSNIQLTLGMRLQKYITNYFKNKKQSGVAIVMDVNNGSIISAVSYPEYDLNLFSDGISTKQWNKLINDPRRPFTNKLVHGLYPPGSLIKMGVGMSFLVNKIKKNESSYCSGEFIFANQRFRCWSSHGHKRTNLIKAIAQSCDDYFYKKSYDVGIDNISQTLRDLGYGSQTLVDLPNEFVGTVPNKKWKRYKYNKPWYVGETFISSIGQGYNLVTPMQMAKYTALLATGKEVIPHFIKQVGDLDISYTNQNSLDEKYNKPLKTIQKAMYYACNKEHGTGFKHVKNSKFTLSCKTGTTQVMSMSQSLKKRVREKDLSYFLKSHSWFTAYFPRKKPKYSITILIEHGGYGSRVGPMVADIANYMKRLRYVK
jgi:penicillin-binding protein 2